ncbi:MAG: VWA domain-containing protein [Planctomycetes bacterium]|nr:VWA domain-containing protein [Planctomycetota bacterium]
MTPRSSKIALALTLSAALAACSRDEERSGSDSQNGKPSLGKDALDGTKAPPPAYADTKEEGWTTTRYASASGSGGESDRETSEGGGGRFGGHSEALRRGGADMPPPGAPAPEPEALMEDAAPRPAAGPADPAGPGPAIGAAGDGAAPPETANPLKAGEVDDNEKFDEYLAYHQDQAKLLPEGYRLDISERYVLEVTDEKGRTLPNCRIGIAGDDHLLWEGRTDSRGRLGFFPRTVKESEGVKEFQITFQYGDHTTVKDFSREPHGSDEPWKVQLPVAKRTGAVDLDLLFLLDTTGSMGDEIARVQATLLSITDRIRKLEGNPRIRYGMVLYRDLWDEYVTRRFGFTDDVEAFDKALHEVSANGGGDGPEAMNMGLFAAVDQMDWGKESLRLAFLVADASPHMDYTDDVPYPTTLKSAVARGIKIFPTAASGLEPVGSYVYRQIAQFTLARFLFIEYGGSGATHGVEGSYAQNNLDDIVVRIVREELAAFAE